MWAIATSWVSRFARDEGRNAKLLTHHYYREGPNPTSSIENCSTLIRSSVLCLRKSARFRNPVAFLIGHVKPILFLGEASLELVIVLRRHCGLYFMYKLASAECHGVDMETGVN